MAREGIDNIRPTVANKRGKIQSNLMQDSVGDRPRFLQVTTWKPLLSMFSWNVKITNKRPGKTTTTLGPQWPIRGDTWAKLQVTSYMTLHEIFQLEMQGASASHSPGGPGPNI